MKDNFDLKKFLKESKAIENLNPTFRRINEAIEPNMFGGWGVIPKYLGGELSNWKVIDRKFDLLSKAEGMGPKASMVFEFKNNKDFKIGYLAIFVSLVDPNSRAAQNGAKTEIGYRVSDDIPKEKAKEYISEIQPEIVNLMKKYVSQDLKSLGKAHMGGGYEDKVTEEDKKSFMNQLSKLSSNKNYVLKEDESSKTNTLKDKIREMIINELSEDNVSVGGDVRGTYEPVAPITPASNNEYDFLSESDDLHEKDESGLADAAVKDIKKKGKDSEWIKNLPKGMADKLLKKIKDEKNLKEAEKDEDGEEMEDESREERADVDKYEFEKGKEDGEKEGGIEAIAADLDGTESDLMGNLMNALKIAKGMDNEKLEVQIGNTLKFFVSTYIDKEENER